MKIIAINGGPRANQNSATLLKNAIAGAEAKGAEVELVSLYKLNYKGCTACFSCKRKGSPSLHRCAVQDELTPVLDKIREADAVIFASPVYLWDLTGEMRSFLERLIFQYLPYDQSVEEGTYFPKKLKTAFIYALGAPESMVPDRFKPMEDFITQIFRVPVKTLYSYFNYPFADDWENYEASDLSAQLKHREEARPQACRAAKALGTELATEEN